jgi:hypothetical protein
MLLAYFIKTKLSLLKNVLFYQVFLYAVSLLIEESEQCPSIVF